MNISELTSSIKSVMGAKGPICGQIATCLDSSFQNFTIQEELGEGTYAKVFRASTEVGNFAYKIFKGKNLVSNQQDFMLSRRKKRGEWLLPLFNEANICKCHYSIALRYKDKQVYLLDNETVKGYIRDPNLLEGRKYILLGLLMEYYPDAKDLWDLKFTVPNVCKVAYEIIKGVKSIHDGGIMHRDLKPENILITKEGRVIIADFGSAAIIPSTGRRASVVGTLDYLPPQIVTAYKNRAPEEYSKNRDHYSIAMILYILTIKQFPWEKGGESGKAEVSKYLEKGIGDEFFLSKIKNEALATLIRDLGKYFEDERITLEKALEYPCFDAIHESSASSPRQEQFVLPQSE